MRPRSLFAALLLTACPLLRCEDWPEFRGPTGQGTSTAIGLPTEWSATKNVAWKVPVPGAGWSSPAISGGQIFLTTGVPNASGGVSLRALALDLASGRALWETEVFSATEASVKPVHTKNSPASPTAIVEGDRIYLHFGHHGTACLDRAGKILWRNHSLRYDPLHGNGGSPALAGDRLVFNSDGTKDPFVVALEKATGEVAWKVPRGITVKSYFSFCTPLVISVHGRIQIITPGSGAVWALDPKDGREIWRVRYGEGYSVVPRPVFAHGLLFIATGFNRADLLAIRPDGEGDVTDTHVAWRTTKGAPLTPSVVVAGDELYGVADSGIATCWDAKTGTVHWQERIEGNYSASPIVAEGKIFFLSEEGVGTVVKAARTFEKIATNKLEERALASYAVADGALFIRTAGHLYRIGRR
ncbi:MAG: serine/threonine protein kinase [Opitutia bacterium]|nr:MAG: serine/threonine protein kinase [Opitutae bacterium]